MRNIDGDIEIGRRKKMRRGGEVEEEGEEGGRVRERGGGRGGGAGEGAG